ncbi:COG4315 family predicted lipoprotein [Streptantibioticus silvisoli]|uniref:Lipoprotein with Yx(FWY)xxD motif n=1 Tax=Streptantibioticus silvisoli TaxID=2705255 RepID=A0ABT6VW94_9ACTN|nr:hypothetical protein [Streptantibioticus silvisoli]MDI5962760.1 hypothetical protein [Streptantibioticus silvisoli]
MRRMFEAITWTVAAVTIAAAASGCSNGTGSSAASSASPSGTASGRAGDTPVADRAAAAKQAQIKTASVGSLGSVLVDGTGRTLYLFEADRTSKSTCNGACATAWPPTPTSGKAKAGGRAKSDLLGTTKRSDGKEQVTYHGHPLYQYAGDSKSGQANGEGLNQFGAEWYVLDASGKKVDKS